MLMKRLLPQISGIGAYPDVQEQSNRPSVVRFISTVTVLMFMIIGGAVAWLVAGNLSYVVVGMLVGLGLADLLVGVTDSKPITVSLGQ